MYCLECTDPVGGQGLDLRMLDIAICIFEH